MYIGSYVYESMGFVLFMAWSFFLYSLITWLCYMFNAQSEGVDETNFSINHKYASLNQFKNARKKMIKKNKKKSNVSFHLCYYYLLY